MGFGCLCFETVTNKNAFNAESIRALNVRIIKASHNQFNKTTSSKMRKFITYLLVPDDATRPTAADATKMCSMFKVDVPPGLPQGHDRLRRAHHQGRAPPSNGATCPSKGGGRAAAPATPIHMQMKEVPTGGSFDSGGGE